MAVNKVDEKELLKVKDELAKLQKSLAIVESDKQEAEDALLELSQHLTAQEESLELLHTNSNSTIARSTSSDSELDSLYARLKKSELEAESLSEQLLAKDLSMSQLFTEIGDLKDLLEHYQSIESNQNQESSRQSKEFQSQLSQLQKQLSAMEQQGEEYQKLSDSDKAAIAKLLAEKSQTDELVEQYKNDLERATESLSKQQKQLDEHIELTNNQVLTTAEINKQLASLKQDNEHKTFELDTLQAELDGYKSDIEKQADVITDTQMVNASLTERVEHLEESLETEIQAATGYKLQFQNAELLNTDLTSKLETFNTLQTELESAQLKLSKLERRNAELIQAQVKQEQSVDQSVVELENKVTALNDLLDDESSKHKSEIAVLRKQLDNESLALKATREEKEKSEELFAASQAELRLSQASSSKLESKVSQLEDTHQTTIEALRKAESELAQVKGELAKVESELAQTKAESAKVESELEQTKAKLVTTLEQLHQATSGLDVSQSEMASLRHSDAENEKVIADLKSSIAYLEERAAKVEESAERKRTELEAKAAVSEAKLGEAEKTSLELEAKVTASEAKLSEAESELSKVERALNELERELGKAKDNAAELALKLEETEKKSVELSGKETTLKEQLRLASESESEQVSMLKGEVDEQQQKVDAAELRISELTAKLEQVESHQQTHTSQLQSDIESTRAQLALANDLVVQGQQKVSGLESELHHYKNAVDEKEQVISKLSRTDEAMLLLEKNNLTLTNELQNIGEAKQELQRQLDYAEQKAASLQAQLSTSQSVSTEQSDQLLETNIEFNDLIERLKVENAQYRNDYEKLKVRLDDSLEQLAQVDDDLIKDQHRMLELADELRKEKEQRHQFEHELNLVNELEQQHREELESYKQGHIEESELVAEAEVSHARTVIQQLRAENNRLKLDLDEKISDLESQVTEYRLKFNFAQQQLVEQQQLSD